MALRRILVLNGTTIEELQPADAINGLQIGVDVQAYDADLAAFAGKTAPTGDVVGTTDTQTLSNKTLTGTKETVFTITDGAAFEINPANGAIQVIVLGATRTPKGTNFAEGHSVTMMIDDGAAAYQILWTDTTFGPTGVKWVGGSAPSLPTTGYGIVMLWKVGSQVYGKSAGNA